MSALLQIFTIVIACSWPADDSPSISVTNAWSTRHSILSHHIASTDTAIDTNLTFSGNKNVVRCIYNSASEGDCPYIKFSCGDFGLAEFRLNAQDQALWNALYSDGPNGYVPNDDLVGKVFQITYQKTSVKACDGSEDLHQVDAPLVIGFKLISNP